ncbi:ABC transporter ATP-binding protein [Clostridiaceae bacterium M8S5]|nr:ABC transporter ATP-binding protein [Clostridiaceae bacterium M8S5]
MYAIEVNKLVKQYKNGVRALDELSLKVKRGEIFSLLGANGAGKSTLINILTTYYAPTAGSVIVLGKNLSEEPAWIRANIACVAQNVSIDEHLSLMENMIFQSSLYKINKSKAKKRIDNLIESFGLSKYLKYPVAVYSGGVKRRLDIAMNMVSHPQILFLDEPTVGMDISSRKAMWETVEKIRDEFKTTVFMTTHYLEEADQLSDTICIIKEGKEIVRAAPLDLRQFTKQDVLKIGFSNVKQAKCCKSKLSNMQISLAPSISENSVLVDITKDRSLFKSINQWLLQNNICFESIEIKRPDLNDVFLKFTDGERR